MRPLPRLLLPTALALALGGLAGCKPTMLPGTAVEATPEHRSLATAVEVYRKALESKDVNAVMELVSAEYFEDGGTADPSDDYNYDGLKQHLTDDLSRVQVLRVSVKLQDLGIDGDRGFVDYRFQVRSLVSLPAQDQWITKTDDNRLSFRREGGKWRIVAGL